MFRGSRTARVYAASGLSKDNKRSCYEIRTRLPDTAETQLSREHAKSAVRACFSSVNIVPNEFPKRQVAVLLCCLPHRDLRRPPSERHRKTQASDVGGSPWLTTKS